MTILASDMAILRDYLTSRDNAYTDWTRLHDKDDYKLYYRHEEGMPICSLMMERHLKAPVKDIMAIIFEMQLFKDWVPFMTQSRVVKKFSRLRQICQFMFWLPWPMQSRQIWVQMSGMEIPAEKAFVITANTIKSNHYLGVALEREPDRLEILFERTSFYARLMPDNRLRVTATINANPQMKHIPKAMINWVLQKCCMVILNMIEGKAQKLDASYVRQIEANADTYELIEQIIQGTRPATKAEPNGEQVGAVAETMVAGAHGMTGV